MDDIFKEAIRKECSKVLGTKETKKLVIRKIGNSSGVSAVFSLNNKIVAKAAQFSGNSILLLNNKKYVWDKFKLINDNKDVLKKLVPQPFFYKLSKNQIFMSFEPLIKGRTLSEYLKDAVFLRDHLPKFLFILYDVLLYLGQPDGFNHNDLHESNIMVVRSNDIGMNSEYTSLCIKQGETSCKINKVKYFPVLIDFDWSTFMPDSRTSHTDFAAYINKNANIPSPPNIADCSQTWKHVHLTYSLPYYGASLWSPTVDVAFLMLRIGCVLGESLKNNINTSLNLFINNKSHEIKQPQKRFNISDIATRISTSSFKDYNIYNLMHLLAEILFPVPPQDAGKQRKRSITSFT